GRNDLGLDRAALDDRSTAARLLLVIGDHRQCLANDLLFGRGTALGLFLGTTTRLSLGLQAGFFLGLTARGFFLLAPAALIFLGTANRILGRALALLDLTDAGVHQCAAARIHLVAGQRVQHHAATRLGRCRARRLRRDWCNGSRLRRTRL